MRIKPDIRIELNIVLFGALLNFAWEVQQMPMFDVSAVVTIRQAIWGCTQATLGDALILLIAFWIVSICFKTRHWLFEPTKVQMLMFVAFGLLITVLIEALSTSVLNRWQYNELMPTLPLLGTGLLPVLQWLLLPPCILWLVRRQLLFSIETNHRKNLT